MNVAPAKPEFRVTTYGTGKLRSKCGEIWRGSLGERGGRRERLWPRRGWERSEERERRLINPQPWIGAACRVRRGVILALVPVESSTGMIRRRGRSKLRLGIAGASLGTREAAGASV